jgi:SseB protein N-terminal domain
VRVTDAHGSDRPTFAGDDGSVPDEVRDVLGRHVRGEVGMRGVVAVLAQHRLLVPLLEVDGDQLEGDDADPCAGQDRAVAAVSVRTGEGSRGLAFSGMGPLTAWRAEARPLPVAATQVAAALVQEGAVGLDIDVAGPAPCHLPALAVARLAAGGHWPEPWADPTVRQAVWAELGPVLASGEVQVRLAAPDVDPGPIGGAIPAGAPADDVAPGLLVEVRFAPGLPATLAVERAAIIAERLAGSDVLRAAYDGVLGVRVL